MSYILNETPWTQTLRRDPCAYCGTTYPYPLTIDHIIPVSKGGTDDPVNLTAACSGCNARKGNMGLVKFIHINNIALSVAQVKSTQRNYSHPEHRQQAFKGLYKVNFARTMAKLYPEKSRLTL